MISSPPWNKKLRSEDATTISLSENSARPFFTVRSGQQFDGRVLDGDQTVRIMANRLIDEPTSYGYARVWFDSITIRWSILTCAQH